MTAFSVHDFVYMILIDWACYALHTLLMLYNTESLAIDISITNEDESR